MSNRNILWGQVFVEELARSGLKAVCVAPGSRHTPLMLAFAKHPDIKVYSHLDERSASFFALGLALASDEPVALVCSSGTAGANMYPAIIEAHQSRVPLIVLTADRPHELRHSGANQTIDQIKMFGDFVLWFVDMQLPEANPPAIAIRNLRTTANRAYAKANGLRKGVVHLNFPFRKPLEPTEVEDDMVDVPKELNIENRHFHISQPIVSTNDCVFISAIIKDHPNGVFICADNNTGKYRAELSSLAKNAGYPILAESRSQIRHKESGEVGFGGYEMYLQYASKPDVVIRFGDVPISNELSKFLGNNTTIYEFHITEDGVWSDDFHGNTFHIQTDFGIIIEWIHNYLPYRENFHSALKTQYTALEDTTWQVIDHEIENGAYFDGAVVYDVVDLLPNESTLFVGNSLPVRHLDQFGKPQDKRIYTYANRGASGIDGNISTALGAGSARPDKPLVAIFGDITFYHDMNGLLAVHRCGVPITIVLINNDGGGIFNRLPIKDYEPEFTDYFITPHGLDFSHTAKLYGLDYIQFDAREGQQEARIAFRETFSEVVGSEKSTIIEVRTDGKFDDARRKEIVALVHQQLETLDL
ncbi:MAG: 2-succinyl-5-enolpyruvyl-6-hydroxy-3-cyclohexene-1-carboxylic-acid synthase [Phototrophicaceae bacterium]